MTSIQSCKKKYQAIFLIVQAERLVALDSIHCVQDVYIAPRYLSGKQEGTAPDTNSGLKLRETKIHTEVLIPKACLKIG